MLLHKANPGFPSKQPLLPSKQIIFSNSQQPHYDYLNSSKYAELFTNPTVNPNMYSFDAPIPTYPLDTVIPSYLAPQKTSHDPTDRVVVGGASDSVGVHFSLGRKATNSELENLLTTPTTKAVSPATELENLFKMPEADFTSLMSAFAPTNMDPQERGPADFAIPSATTGIFDSFPPGFFSEGGSPSSSASPPATMPRQQPMDSSWRAGEGEKWVGGLSFSTNSLPLRVSESDPSALWSAAPHSSSSSSSHSELTPLLEAFPPLDHDLSLPSSSSSSSSSPPSHLHTPTVSPLQITPNNHPNVATASNGEQNLTFEEHLDFFDGSLDWDSILPPMKRLQEFPPTQSGVSSPVSHMHISPAPTPTPSSPSSPVETKPVINSSFPSEISSEKSAKPSPLLFGKTEDEILLKVLAHRPSPDSKPVTRERLVSMPVEDFNRLLDTPVLSDIEVAFMKEWRRRGKNKTAAMVARKRKRDELSDLDEEVEQLRKQKAGLRSKYEQLRAEIAALKERTRTSEERVYRRYSRQSGVQVSRDTHVIHVDKTGKVLLGPRPSSQQMLLVK